MIRRDTSAAFTRPKKRQVDMVTGLYQTDITRFWKAANRPHLPKPNFTKGQLAAFMRRHAHQVTQAGTLWRCAYCRHLLTGAQICYDHKSPLSVGGRNALDNIAICCETCNREKDATTESDFAALHMLYDGKLGYLTAKGAFAPVQISGTGVANIRARLRAKPTWGGRNRNG